MPLIDRERLFQLLFTQQWELLFEQLYEHRKELHRDPILQQLEQVCTTEYVSYLTALPAPEQVASTRHVGMLVMTDRKFFPPQFWKPVMAVRIQALFDVQDATFAGLASEFSAELPLAGQLLEALHRQRPEELADARRSALNIKAVAVATSKAAPPAPRHVTPLFRSPQERAFFDAVERAYPELMAFPNAPLSVALAYEPIKAALSQDARDFFFKGQFDCVIFDREGLGLPLYFFELDSSWHNTPEAQVRDRLKDQICRAAGVKLLRIRAFEAEQATTSAFEQLVRELIDPLERPRLAAMPI